MSKRVFRPGTKIAYEWKPWFAWFPVVTVSGKLIWGRKCFKRRVFYWGFPRSNRSEYATAFDLLKLDQI